MASLLPYGKPTSTHDLLSSTPISPNRNAYLDVYPNIPFFSASGLVALSHLIFFWLLTSFRAGHPTNLFFYKNEIYQLHFRLSEVFNYEIERDNVYVTTDQEISASKKKCHVIMGAPTPRLS
jgi:hypothetical protein